MLRIVSYSDKAFGDRQEAGRLLAEELKNLGLGGKDTVILGIPRGGLIVAAEIAHKLNVDLDIMLSRKIGAPANPELAIGAVSEDGSLFIDDVVAFHTGADKPYIKQEKARQMTEIARRAALFRSVRPKVSLKDKTVIVTDDGLATGSTMQAALWAIRKEEPKKIIMAIPVSPQEALARISASADETICLRIPSFFSAVGQFYRNFVQTEDEEVLEILKAEAKRKTD